MSGEQRISDERLAEIEALVAATTPEPWDTPVDDPFVVGEEDAAFINAARTDVPALVADLRAARAEIERYKEADIARAVQTMGPPWQCSGCGHVYRGRLKKTCPECGRLDYFSGSVRVDALAKYDVEQAEIIRARGAR